MVAVMKPVAVIGRYTLFCLGSTRCMFWPPLNYRLVMVQLEFVGNRSIGIVILAALMIGAIFGLQLGHIFRIFGAESMLGAASAFALAKELAPVTTAMLVTCRAGSAMAAEIATMRVNEQIDAMRVMAVNPLSYLVAPRLLASLIMTPLLSGVFVLVGTISAFGLGVSFYDIDVGIFIERIEWIVEPKHILEGEIKAFVFGGILSTVGCFCGYYAGGGAKGVGRSTTVAVVTSLVAILIVDFFLSYLQFQLFD